jgi:hypothetical protein
MTVLLVLFVVAAVIVVGVVVSDRFVAGLAERKASEYLAAPLGRSDPGGVLVRVHGSPFLTQAVRGRYGDVEVTAADLQLGALAGATLHAHLINVYLPLADLLGRRAAELPVEHVHGQVVVPYAELARISPLPGLAFDYQQGRLIASAALPIPGFSQLARLSGEAVLTITDSGGVWLRVRAVAFAGISVPSIVLNQVVPTLSFPVPLPPLPYGLRIEQLTPLPGGLEVSGSARAVVFRGVRDPAM